MDVAIPKPKPTPTLFRTLTKLLRIRKKTKKPFYPDHLTTSSVLTRSDDSPSKKPHVGRTPEATDSLLSGLFASISAVKAAYAQLQMAQSPYDPESIQSADRIVVAELKRASQLKHAFLTNSHLDDPSNRLESEIEENKNLIQTYQITHKKLEFEFLLKKREVETLVEELGELERKNEVLEGRFRPGRSLTGLDGLHLSGLSPGHFVAALRYTLRSVRTFSKVLVAEMECSRWDLDNAANAAVSGELCDRRDLAFQAYVARVLFSDFYLPSFGLHQEPSRSRAKFFEEFVEIKGLSEKEALEMSSFRGFCFAKFEALVNPKMEVGLFGDLEQRRVLGSERGVPETRFGVCFVEMARRVWLLHRLFFSFEAEAEVGVFQHRKGCRFSEVYMESLGSPEMSPETATVAFTVVPGFKLRKTVVQSKVYLQRDDRRP